MILTGPEIFRAYAAGEVSIEPFFSANLNPNSYNFHLGDKLIRLAFRDNAIIKTPIQIDCGGYLLAPGNLYLAITAERIGSHVYAMTLLGRSSIGRLGLFLNATADLGHVGSDSHWTLEISVVQPVYIYPFMRIGQVAFWTVDGEAKSYQGRYHRDLNPEPSKDLIRATADGGTFDSVGRSYQNCSAARGHSD